MITPQSIDLNDEVNTLKYNNCEIIIHLQFAHLIIIHYESHGHVPDTSESRR